MPDSGLRNLGTIVPGAPAAPAPPPGAAQRQPQTPLSRAASAPPSFGPGGAGGAPVFAADAADDPAALASAALGLDAPLQLLAELASHARTQTPLAIGLFGPAGCGKSVALNKLTLAVERLGAAAANVDSGPFIAPIATVRVDAADLNGNPATALAEALYARLASVAPALVMEAGHAARDPDVAAREAFERLDAARLKLETERRALDEADARRAKLAETLLYDTPGSQIDAYATGRRGRIKAAMDSFGIAGDPLLGFKDMVAEVADASGPSRTSFALRAFFGLKGQKTRIVLAILLALIGLGLGAAFEHQSTWLDALQSQPQTAGAAGWIGAHADWLLTLRTAAFIGAGLALLSNIWRGARILQLVSRGESLLKAELVERRRDSDGHFGHQTRRVENLTADVERLSRQAAEAERRAGGLKRANPALAEPSPFAGDAQTQEARRFIAAVGALATRTGGNSQGLAQTQPAGSPRRIIVALDNLDALPVPRACEILAKAHSLLGPGYVSLVALDPARFDGDFARSLDKWIAAPLQIGEITARRDAAAQIRDILGAAPTAAKVPAAAVPDAKQSVLDEPLSEAETQLLAAFAPLAGSARAVKRFVNLYRLLRPQWRDRPEERGALAFMVALDAGGSAGEVAAVNAALASIGGDAAFEPYQAGPRVSAMLAALGAQGRPSIDALRRAAAAARAFSFRPGAIENA